MTWRYYFSIGCYFNTYWVTQCFKLSSIQYRLQAVKVSYNYQYMEKDVFFFFRNSKKGEINSHRPWQLCLLTCHSTKCCSSSWDGLFGWGEVWRDSAADESVVESGIIRMICNRFKVKRSLFHRSMKLVQFGVLNIFRDGTISKTRHGVHGGHLLSAITESCILHHISLAKHYKGYVYPDVFTVKDYNDTKCTS